MYARLFSWFPISARVRVASNGPEDELGVFHPFFGSFVGSWRKTAWCSVVLALVGRWAGRKWVHVPSDSSGWGMMRVSRKSQTMSKSQTTSKPQMIKQIRGKNVKRLKRNHAYRHRSENPVYNYDPSHVHSSLSSRCSNPKLPTSEAPDMYTIKIPMERSTKPTSYRRALSIGFGWWEILATCALQNLNVAHICTQCHIFCMHICKPRCTI